MTEMWDLYDKTRKPLGKLHERGKPLNSGEFHIVVNILSVNKEGKILITKRHNDKPFGGKWEISGGSVVAGEDSLLGGTRELAEETGLIVQESDLDYRGTIIRRKSGCLHDFYLYRGDFSERDIVLQDGETIDFRLVTPEELYMMKQTGEFIDFLYDRVCSMFMDMVRPEPKLIRNIHHVSMKAPSKEKFDEALSFYCDILGLTIHRQWEKGVLINANGCLIEIFLSDVKFSKGIINHFALGTDDVDKCVQLVREKGYKVLVEPNDKEIPSNPPVKLRMAFVVGPLGEEIEFFKNL